MTTHTPVKQDEEVKAVPGKPVEEIAEVEVSEADKSLAKLVEIELRLSKLETHFFVLRYKHRGAPKMLEFQHKDLESAILRGRMHCQTQGYKFIYVEPVYLDLDALDKRMDDQRRRDDAGERV